MHAKLGYLLLGGAVSAFGFLSIMWLLPRSMPAGPRHSIDAATCDCACWDRVYKGPYYRVTNGSQYKSVWFNYDSTAPILFLWTYLYLALFHGSATYVSGLIVKKRFRWGAVAAYALSIYSHFYGFWCVWNYLNDRWQAH